MTVQALFKTYTESDKSILETAREEFAAKGYHQASVDVMAEKLGIGKGTIYRHFGSKILLFLSVMAYLVREAAGPVSMEIGSGTFEELFDGYLERLIMVNSRINSFMYTVEPDAIAPSVSRDLDASPEARVLLRRLMDEREKGISLLAAILDRGVAEGRLDEKNATRLRAEFVFISVNNIMRVKLCPGLSAQNQTFKGPSDPDLLKEIKEFIRLSLGLAVAGGN